MASTFTLPPDAKARLNILMRLQNPQTRPDQRAYDTDTDCVPTINAPVSQLDKLDEEVVSGHPAK